MFQGNWTCSTCGGTIKELPFEPRSNAGLTCRDCYFKNKNGDTKEAPVVDTLAGGEVDDREVPPFDPDTGIAHEPAPEDPVLASAPVAGERKMFEGNWSCALCGNSISKLPFEPRNTENLKCLDCFKKGS